MKDESIKSSLSHKSRIMVLVLVILLIPINFLFYLRIFHEQQKDRSEQMFHQIERIIEMNERDLQGEREDFSRLCIQKADMAAYFAEHEPDIISDINKIRELATVIDVDEIHFFNRDGEIYTGTHPEYYGYSVDMGGQIGFFRQMLEDVTLKLCQDIMPNTAEEKEMQYAAVWLKDQSQFVQIGMRPQRLLRLMEEKSLQSILESIPFEQREYLHIIHMTEGRVTASSLTEMLGRDFSEYMRFLKKERPKEAVRQLHARFNGKSYCVYVLQYGDYLLVHTYASRYLLQETAISSVVLLPSILLATVCVIAFFIRYVNRNVVNNLLALNKKLKKIEQGDLDEVHMDTHILEFNTLTYYINRLLQSIRFDNKRMLDIVNSGQMPLGVLEYNSFYKRLFLNQWMKSFLGIEDLREEAFFDNKNLIFEKLEEIDKNCVDSKQEIYRYDKAGKSFFVKREKVSDNQSVIYYFYDVSSWWNKINIIKEDSFRDVLTGLLNRRGMRESIRQIFENRRMMREAAVIVLDADGLKRMNDLYGHSVGDEYLIKIASILSGLPEKHAVSARVGGDEFSVLLYGYDTKEEIDGVIGELKARRGVPFAAFRADIEETLEFSIGYSYCPAEGQSYQELMSLADKRMYREKKKRKSER